jgi:hypothetical protein
LKLQNLTQWSAFANSASKHGIQMIVQPHNWAPDAVMVQPPGCAPLGYSQASCDNPSQESTAQDDLLDQPAPHIYFLRSILVGDFVAEAMSLAAGEPVIFMRFKKASGRGLEKEAASECGLIINDFLGCIVANEKSLEAFAEWVHRRLWVQVPRRSRNSSAKIQVMTVKQCAEYFGNERVEAMKPEAIRKCCNIGLETPTQTPQKLTSIADVDACTPPQPCLRPPKRGTRQPSLPMQKFSRSTCETQGMEPNIQRIAEPSGYGHPQKGVRSPEGKATLPASLETQRTKIEPQKRSRANFLSNDAWTVQEQEKEALSNLQQAYKNCGEEYFHRVSKR